MRYSIGQGTVRVALASDFIRTTLSAAEAAAQTTLSVTSVSDNARIMANADIIGIELDDGTMHWTTINDGSIAVGDTTIVITTGLASAAAAGNSVYTYTTAWATTTDDQLPKRLLHAWTVNDDKHTRIVQIISEEEYAAKADKTSEGYITEVRLDPQLTASNIFVWPVPSGDQLDEVLHLIVERIIEDIDTVGTHTPDFPQEWYLPLVLNLAVLMCPVYGVPVAKFQEIKLLADAALKDVLDYDTETTSLYISPDKGP